MYGVTSQQLIRQPLHAQTSNNFEDKLQRCISLDSSMDVLFSNNAIATMLHNVVESDGERLDRELDELKETGMVKAASTSLIATGIAANVFRDLGLLIDSRECEIHCMYSGDAGTIKVDKFERKVTWNPVKKSHCIFNPGSNDFDISATAPVGFKVMTKKRKVESLSELEAMIKSKYDQCRKEVAHNEVVVDYPVTSCIGVIATKNRNLCFNQATKDQKIIEEALKLQDRIRSEFKILLPIIIYDCQSGEVAPL